MPDQFDELKRIRSDWKKKTLYGSYAPEEIDYLRYIEVEEERTKNQDYIIPELPLRKRFEGMWVVGSQGSGKTVIFKTLAKSDLDMVAAGRAFLFILDPTGDQPEAYDEETGEFAESATLIHTITRLRRFYKGGDLHRKLVYINPEERDYYLPINLFALGANPDDEDAADSVTDSYVSIINGLLGQTLSPFQDPVLRHAILATMAFPNPNLSTLREVLATHPPATRNYTPPRPKYEEILHKLHPDVQSYFRTSYDSQRETRTAVLARLSSLTTSARFRRIFGASKMKFNLNDLINEPKVVIINASRDYLGSLKELYGRFFLSLLKRAGEVRPSGSIPCFAYVDEADEFIRDDQYAGDIIFKLRRKRVALMLGNQSTSKEQISQDKTRRALFSTAIKLVNVNEPDSAKELAEALNLREGHSYDTSHFLGRDSFDFAYYARGVTTRPISYRVKPGMLEAEPKMTEQEWQEVWEDIRDRYYEPVVRDMGVAPAQSIAVRPIKSAQPAVAEVEDDKLPFEATKIDAIDTEGARSWGLTDKT